MTDGCGPSSRESFARYDLATRSWKTSQGSLWEEWATFSGTWPRRGMTRNGFAYALQTSARPTGGSESSSWPTPQARDWKGPSGNQNNTPNEVLKNWPTPNAADAKRDTAHKAGNPSLPMAAKAWNTPRSRDWKGQGKDCLPSDVAMWQTPQASMADAGARTRGGDRKDELLLAGQALQGTSSTDGSRRASYVLSAAWVATLMGLPADWLDGIEPP